MIGAAADGGKLFWRRCSLARVVVSPTCSCAVLPQSTGKPSPVADAGECFVPERLKRACLRHVVMEAFSPTRGSSVLGPEGAGEVTAGADVGETLAVGGRRLSQVIIYCVPVGPPADHLASILFQPAGVNCAAGYRAERCPLWGRGHTVLLPSPADGCPIVLEQPAAVVVAGTDGGEPLVLGGRCLAIVVVSPADGGAIRAYAARMTAYVGSRPSDGYGCEPFPLGRMGLSVPVFPPADWRTAPADPAGEGVS